MKLFQIFLCGAAALGVLLFTGCDNSEPKDLPAIEQASNDGSGMYGPNGTLLGADGGWVAGSDLNAINGGNGAGGVGGIFNRALFDFGDSGRNGDYHPGFVVL